MLHLLYILAFTILAFLAVGNLIRNLMTLGLESQRHYAPRGAAGASGALGGGQRSIPHPELLDDSGNLLNEPYLVMRSISVEDAREKLDALYRSSPGVSGEAQDETA
jgi:hypothetical protein